jgi:hypothetical protein
VWLVLVNGQADAPIAGFWEQADAVTYAEALRVADPGGRPLVREVVLQGARHRCRLCGEPVVLDDRSDPMSWIHAEDANDLGDHTAEV